MIGFRRKTLADLLTRSLRQADGSGDVAPDWITGLEDSLERAKLEALLDAKDSDARLDAEWLAAQEQIRQTWSG